MTGNQEIPGRKRRSSEEIKRLVLEFEASGLRQNAFCRNQGLALSTLQRQLKEPGRSILPFGQLPLLGSFEDIQSGSRSERRSWSRPLQFVARDSKETFLIGPVPIRKRTALTVGGNGETLSQLHSPVLVPAAAFVRKHGNALQYIADSGSSFRYAEI